MALRTWANFPFNSGSGPNFLFNKCQHYKKGYNGLADSLGPNKLTSPYPHPENQNY